MSFPFDLKTLAGSLCALGALLYFGWLGVPATDPPPVPLPELEPALEPALDAFGLEADRFTVETVAVQRGQTFSEILQARGVAPETIRLVAEEGRPIFDVRRLQAGKTLRLYQDSTQTARLAVYERNAIDYVVFDLTDAARVYEGRRPVEVRQRAVSGVLEASPYATLARLGADPALAVKLAEVFAWQIDFYRLQRGDRFAIVYEEQRVEGETVGSGAILAARFAHAGTDFYAFRFDGDGQAAYYDERGRSLKKAFLKAPLKYSRISSRYSKRRFHPVLKRYKAHLGTDYAAPAGTPILATGDGVVTAAAYTRGNGRYVKIRHNQTYTTGYLHMSRIGKGIRAGVRVRQGDVIGYVGSTGLATGPHLCYRFWKNGMQVDPLRLELPTADPIDAEHRPAFEAVRARLLAHLHDDTPPTITDERPPPALDAETAAP